MSEYLVEAKSRKDLRALAKVIRKIFKLENVLYIPIVDLLDVFSIVFDNFSYEIVDDTFFPNHIHAETDVKTGHIKIRESIYNNAINGNGRDRMTIAHEFGHYFTLCFCGFKLYRNFSKDKSPCRDPEWQAKCFAGELLIPKELVKNLSVNEIAEKCGVSKDAAMYQKNQYLKEGD